MPDEPFALAAGAGRNTVITHSENVIHSENITHSENDISSKIRDLLSHYCVAAQRSALIPDQVLTRRFVKVVADLK